jgi:hypothetical protein
MLSIFLICILWKLARVVLLLRSASIFVSSTWSIRYNSCIVGGDTGHREYMVKNNVPCDILVINPYIYIIYTYFGRKELDVIYLQ